MIHASYLCLMCRLNDPKSISNFCLCMPSMMSCTHFILAKHPRAVCEVNAVSKKETCTNTCLCTLPCQKVTYPYISHPKVGKMRLISSIWWDMHGFLEGKSSHSSFQETHPTAPSHPVPVVLSGAAPGWVWWGFHTDVPMFAATSLGDPTTCCEYV